MSALQISLALLSRLLDVFHKMYRCFLLFCGLLCAVPLAASEPRPQLNVGDLAPAFECVDDQGGVWKLTEQSASQTLVLYFFPADLSTTCTRQAREFQRVADRLRQQGVRVVGVSGDSVENHRVFKEHCGLDFCLLADVNGAVARAFGVPVRQGGKITRVVDGRQTVLKRRVTTQRWTFVIGQDRRILYKNTDVDVTADCNSVAKAVGLLTASTQ